MIGMLIAVTVGLALWAFCLAGALRNELRESEQIRDALVSAVHDCRAEIARLRLTDSEREAVEYFARDNWAMSPVLRGLLERTK